MSGRRLAVACAVAFVTITLSADALPLSDSPFKGKINLSAEDSIPDWPEPVRAPEGAPNILLIMLDDVGFGDTSTFGGDAQTPALTQLAEGGLRYNRFHTVGLCSPTRAALLSGRNHHRVGFGVVGEAGYPGYNGVWKNSTASVAEILRRHGYSTAAFGKWHNTPFREISPMGPFDRWPTGLGFEYYYGNMVGVSSQWEPSLWRNTLVVHQPKSVEEGYHYTSDIVDDAIRWLNAQRSLAGDKPYFMYFATGAAHSPHHVPSDWIARYKGKFDQGWDKLREEIFVRQKSMGVIPANAKLAPRPKQLPLWSSLTPESRRIAAREMEVFAAFVAHTDHEIGRLIDAVRSAPGGANTLILYIVGDNGAENGALHGMASRPGLAKRLEEIGGPKMMNGYSAGWAIAGTTPFPWAKGNASHLGATRNPLVVSWPARIKDNGGLRTQFTHVNDVASTLLEVTGISMPDTLDGIKQLPLDGASFAYSFDSAQAPSRHRQQYFEIWGNRAIYKDGWIAAALHKPAWDARTGGVLDSAQSFADDAWELYHLDEDFSQANNLARKYPEKVAELSALFDQEARRNDVYPLISSDLYGHMPPLERKSSYFFAPGTTMISYNGPQFTLSDSAGVVGNFRIEADAVVLEDEAEGIIVSEGSRFGGFALYVKDDRLIFEQRSDTVGLRLVSQVPLPRGTVLLAFEYTREKSNPSNTGSIGRLYVNGQLAAEARMTVVPPTMAYGMFSVGEAFGIPVSDSFRTPFKFSGDLQQVRIQLK